MKNIGLKIIRFFILLKIYKNRSAAAFLSSFPGNHTFDESVEITCKNNTFKFPGRKSELSFQDVKLLGGHWNSILKLIKEFDFYTQENKLLMSTTVNNKSVRFIADSSDIGFAAREIFSEKLYDFYDKGDYVFFDVGMNRALASLFLSCFDNIKKIYAFEPFEDTFNMAKKNLELNPVLAEKIQLFNAGWSDKTEKLRIALKKPGFLGASTGKEALAKENDTNAVVINTINASEILSKLMQDIPQGTKMALKMDCEGAEYGIIEDLNRTGLLSKIKLIMLEWHDLGKDKIVQTLINNSFSFFSHDRDEDTPMGMVYAINTAF